MKKIIFLFFLLLFSCGIDDIIFLEPPNIEWDPTGIGDEAQMFFQFKTSDAANNNPYTAGYFRGFDIFYRIYESENECRSAVSSAKSYNDSNPSNAASYLLSTHSFRFLTYTGRAAASRPLIQAALADRSVRFRLSAFGTDADDLRINGVIAGRVLRQNGKDFKNIVRTDFDVKPGSSATGNDLYVAVFAAAYGSDSSFRSAYSKILPIGYVKIAKPSDF